MATLPLTLETLPSNPQCTNNKTNASLPNKYQLNADAINVIERPTHLTLEDNQQESHLLYGTPSLLTTATAATLSGNTSPALSSTGSLSPSFLPEMPQWKRDLIQRRKLNVQRTISASSPSTATAATLSSTSSTNTIGSGALYGGLKTSASLSSVRSLAGSNTNIDQIASDGLLQQQSLTKDYTILKINKQQYAATTTTTTATPTHTLANNTKPATIKLFKSSTPSPLKEKAEKLFGGQYTATTFSPTTTTTKEEIFTQYQFQQQQHQQSQQRNLFKKVEEEVSLMEMAENQNNKNHPKLEGDVEEEAYEIFEKTKEKHKEKSDEEEAEYEIKTINTTSASIITNKQETHQEMATRLTGSNNTHTTTTNTSSSSTSLLKRTSTNESSEREILHSHFSSTSITGANVSFVNQSLNKCESERLVCSENTITFNTSNINNSGNSNNLNNSATSISSSTGGGINISNSANSVSVANVGKISQKLQENQFIKNEQQLQQQQQKKIVRYQKQNINLTKGGGGGGLDLKSPTKCFLTTSTSSSSLAAVVATTPSPSTFTATKKKMVAVQEMKKTTQNSASHLHPITSTCNAQQQQQQQANRANNRGIVGVCVEGGVVVSNNATTNTTDLDSSEDLSYGPGIVSKLRCRYLSLALRETMEQQRLNKEHLRRSTSLNNLLDNTEDDEEDEDEEEENIIEEEADQQQNNEQKNSATYHYQHQHSDKKTSGILKSSLNHSQEKRFSHNSQGSNGVGVTFTETSSINKRSRHLKRGNDSLKRARSVEALLSEKSPWQVRNNSSAPTCVTIEDKIHNARERLHQGTDHMPPKRLTSIIDDTERPPPDLVKQTLKMFEATANRRPRLNNRSNSKGDVASKVETFKNIIKEQKPVVNYPKPISPTKKLQKPLKTSTPQANDLLQSPLGRKVMAATVNTPNLNNSNFSTPVKSSANNLSEHTPDIIPRQTQNKYNTENVRDFKQINKENSKEIFEVDSPLTALTKELSKMKLNDSNNTTPIKKNDNSANCASSSSVSSCDKANRESAIDGSGAAGDNNDDACQRHSNKYIHNEETSKQKQQELNIKTLQQAESDKIINNKIKQINSETILSSTATTTLTSSTSTPTPPTSTTIDNKNETTAVNNCDFSLVKTEMALPSTSSSDLSDGNENDEQDGYAGVSEINTTTKRITRTALDNIAKAGFTQQFKFSNSSSVTSSQSSSSISPLTAGKQIGVIRPLLNTTNTVQTKSLENMETLKHTHNMSSSPLTSREIEKNRINDLKKSSQNTTSSPTSASLDNVIKTSTPANASPAAAGASGVSSGFSDVDTVISATNSPLWAMRKRRQTPPAAPTDNTTMVFNFSNRKEVPDYIENDGVIFRRKRELPKPNESGFVLLGDLSVETSTDMDYDDFSMCPPSPCDVEFVNANIVIDGKSSIRQKSKDATHYRVQFNDTLTSTFEYPSEASLCVDDSFSAYNESYTQPHGSSAMANDFTQAFQNLCLDNSSLPQQHHHVADEIIQLPTINASTPAANSSPLHTSNVTGGGGASTTPTKNILGNLPLDYPVLEKGIPLTNSTTNTATTSTLENAYVTSKTQDNNEQITQLKKKSRKDLKLPLVQQNQQQEPKIPIKPPLPVKRFQVIKPPAATVKSINLKNLPGNLKSYEEMEQNNEGTRKNVVDHTFKQEVFEYKPKLRKTPCVLSKPQYACFLRFTTEDIKYPIQRSRSNEFQKTYSSTLSVTTSQVARSNSLRNLDNFPLKRAPTSTTNAAHALYFSAEVNPTKIFKENYPLNDVNANEKPFNAATLPKSLEILQNELSENSLTETEILNNVTHCSNNLGESGSKASHKSQSFLNMQPINYPNFEQKSQSLNDLSHKTKPLENNNEKVFLSNCSATDEKLGSSRSLSDMEVKSLENVSLSENLMNSSDFLASLKTCTKKNKNDLTTLSHDLIEIIGNRNNGNHTDLVAFSDMNKYPKEKQQEPLNLSANSVDSKNCLQITETLTPHNENNNEANFTVFSDNLVENTENKILATPEIAYDENDMNSVTFSDFKKQNIENSTESKKYDEVVANFNENILKEESEMSELINPTNRPTGNVKESNDILSLTDNTENFKGEILKVTKKNLNKPKIIPKMVYNVPRTLSLTLNTDYVTGYSANVVHKPKNQSGKYPTTEQSTSLCVNYDNLWETTEEIGKPITKIQSKSEENLSSPNKLLEQLENPKKSISCESFSDVVEYSLHRNYIETQERETIPKKTENLNVPKMLIKASDDLQSSLENSKEPASSETVSRTINLSQVNKSLQMSLDSLDDYEDALAITSQNLGDSIKDVNTCDMEASEILEDISVGIDTKSIFDFKNLLTLKKSQTEYCLKNLNKSRGTVLDSNSLPQDENEIYQSACNTLESTANLKLHKAGENTSQTIANAKKEDSTNKTPKTLRVRTTEKILNFTNMASQNVSPYNTFQKSKNFYKNASKSFRNSLKFYETFSEKSSQSATHFNRRRSPVKRCIGLTENTKKSADYNRKMFSKSCRLNRSKTDQNPDSPTENSYSFEYFDAESDRNGNLLNTATVLMGDDLSRKDDSKCTSDATKENTLHCSDPISLNSNSVPCNHAIPKEFYFNNSPRPFKRLYDATTFADNEDMLSERFSVKPIDQNHNMMPYKGPISFTNSTLHIKPFQACKKENVLENADATERLNLKRTTLRSNSFSVADSTKFYNRSTSNLVDSNNFSSESVKIYPNIAIDFPDSCKTLNASHSINIDKCNTSISNSQLNALNYTCVKDHSQNTFSSPTESFQNVGANFRNFPEYSYRKGISKFVTVSNFTELIGCRVTTSNSQLLSTFCSPQLTKNSNSALNSPKLDNLKMFSPNSPYFDDASDSKIEENFRNSLNNLSYTPKIYTNTKHLELKTKLNTTTLPKTTTTQTLMVKDLTKNIVTTPTSFISTTTTPTTTNFPTKVVVSNNSKFKNISYRNSSFSSTVSHKTSAGLCTTSNHVTTTTNKSLITAKCHHNQKATNPPPPPLKKYTTAHIPPKVLPRRVTAMTSTNSKTTTATAYTSTTTTTSTTSTSYLKNSTSTCTSGNIIAPPLRRRIPGNTLYYV